MHNRRVIVVLEIAGIVALLFFLPAVPALLNQCPLYSTCPYVGSSYNGEVSPTYLLFGTGGLVSQGKYQLSLAPKLDPLYGNPGPSVTIGSYDSRGNLMTGFYVAIYDTNGHRVGSGFTPVTFSQLQFRTQYTVEPQGYSGCTFQQWYDTTSTGSYRTFVATNQTQTFNAIFSGTCP